MQKILDTKSSESFRNPQITAFVSGSKIRLERDASKPLETFKEMYVKRQPTPPRVIARALTNEGFDLANLGISVILKLELIGKGEFAVFTRRRADGKCLALISGYWDADSDPTPRSCAERELLEEMLVFDTARQIFLVPKGFTFPFSKCAYLSSSAWTLSISHSPVGWVPSARFKATGLDNCYVYVDARTSSAQAVFTYYATFKDWKRLSIFHAEDHPDKQGNLVTTADDRSIVLFEIQQDRLLLPAYRMKNGILERVSLPEDVYFHPAMAGIDSFGIVSTNKAAFSSVVGYY